MTHRNIPISMVCTTTINGVMTPIKFRIEHKDGSVVQYRVHEVKKIENTRHTGMKTIFYYCVIELNNKPYDVVFRFMHETTKWELARI